MQIEIPEIEIVLTLTVGFALASLFGYLTQLARLSPLLGYLFAGYLIGPYSPGFVADMKLSEQLAEIGVILMMFGVGLHFKWEDLVGVKNIALPGALGQTFISSFAGAYLIHLLGFSWGVGIIIGLAIGVASTVVLVRVLTDYHLLETPQGHIAVGWLIVEDLLTVAILILLPTMTEAFKSGDVSPHNTLLTVAVIAFKFIFLGVLMLTVGQKAVTYILVKVVRTRSNELFTLTILALIFVIATGSTYIFGTSIALGAFLSGMVIGQTAMRHQASVNALPMQDTFVVMFFLSVGMLFDPAAIANNLILFLTVLSIVLFVKPLAAFLIVWGLRYPVKVGITVAIALAQIGEFSFILAQEALKLKILPEECFDIIVACALVSISINPLLFRGIGYIGRYVNKLTTLISAARPEMQMPPESAHKAIVVGYGSVGQSIVRTIEKLGLTPVVIEQNVDVVDKLLGQNRLAVYGDATASAILKSAHIESAKILISTMTELSETVKLVHEVQEINPKIRILVRTRFASDQNEIHRLGVEFICCEEEEIAAFNHALFELAPDF